MLNIIIDYTIFDCFVKNQPAQIPLGTVGENETWNTFWKFLKQDSDVVLTNYKNQPNIFLNNLTTGRKGSKIRIENSFKKPHKCKFPKNQNIQTVFFLNEESNLEKEKYRKNNNFIFGFVDDYREQWQKLSLYDKHKVLPVRENANIRFSSWDQLSEFILPFSDMIIIDNYMFDESVWAHNLFKIIEEFAKRSCMKFNLLLISFVNSKNLNAWAGINDKISNQLTDLGIECNLSIVLTNESIKEHDRGIFTNYLRIKSGDSFVYFDKNGKFLTKGTDIDFHSLSIRDNFNASSAALSNISTIIRKLKKHHDCDKRLFGDLKNGLLK